MGKAKKSQGSGSKSKQSKPSKSKKSILKAVVILALIAICLLLVFYYFTSDDNDSSREIENGETPSAFIESDMQKSFSELSQKVEKAKSSNLDTTTIKQEIESAIGDTEGEEAENFKLLLVDLCIFEKDTQCLEDFISEYDTSESITVSAAKESLAEVYVEKKEIDKAIAIYEGLYNQAKSNEAAEDDVNEQAAYFESKIKELQ